MLGNNSWTFSKTAWPWSKSKPFIVGGIEVEILHNSYYNVLKIEYLTKVVTLYFDALSIFVKISREDSS